MNELTKTPLNTIDDSKLSECNSLSSRAVEMMGVKGLQKYKQLSENISFQNSNMNREVNNQTQTSMKIENQLRSGSNERLNKVRTSHSHSRTRSDQISSREREEYRIRQINNNLMSNTNQYPHEESLGNVWKEALE